MESPIVPAMRDALNVAVWKRVANTPANGPKPPREVNLGGRVSTTYSA